MKDSEKIMQIADVIETLTPYVNKQVSVWNGKGIRNSFETQISVSGKLEQHSTNKDEFRVLINKGTYSYFNAEDVLIISQKGEGVFGDGSFCVIKINI